MKLLWFLSVYLFELISFIKVWVAIKIEFNTQNSVETVDVEHDGLTTFSQKKKKKEVAN